MARAHGPCGYRKAGQHLLSIRAGALLEIHLTNQETVISSQHEKGRRWRQSSVDRPLPMPGGYEAQPSITLQAPLASLETAPPQQNRTRVRFWLTCIFRFPQASYPSPAWWPLGRLLG